MGSNQVRYPMLPAVMRGHLTMEQIKRMDVDDIVLFDRRTELNGKRERKTPEAGILYREITDLHSVPVNRRVGWHVQLGRSVLVGCVDADGVS
jgi:hypothetical protein